MGHSALSHCCRLRHMVLYYLGNTYTDTHRGYATVLFSCMLMRRTVCANTHVEHQLYSLTFMCLTSYSPCREDRANAAISWMVRALLDFGNISMVSSTFTWKDKKKKRCYSREKPVQQLSSVFQYTLPWLRGKPSVVLSWRRASCVHTTSTTSVYFMALESEGFSLYTANIDFNESQAVWQQPHMGTRPAWYKGDMSVLQWSFVLWWLKWIFRSAS